MHFVKCHAAVPAVAGDRHAVKYLTVMCGQCMAAGHKVSMQTAVQTWQQLQLHDHP